MLEIGAEAFQLSKASGVEVLQTALVSLPALAQKNRYLEIASLLSQTPARRLYLIFAGDTEPRRELDDVDELIGAMRLIRALEYNDVPVAVGFCSSDVVLWKYAGATDCASGKFFNLRRFTRERFDEPGDSGGGQLPYWFEEGLCAFLRQPDVIRIRKRIPEILKESMSRNPFCGKIVEALDESARNPGTKQKPWLGNSWRQFLFWFADIEKRLGNNQPLAKDLLRQADANWSKLDEEKILMDERDNDGTWVRSWLNATNEFDRDDG
jgi:hypothetical protein